MAYEITVACEIDNKEYAVGDIIEDEKKVNFFPSVMRKVSAKGIVAEAKASEVITQLTKKEMLAKIEELKYTGDLTEEQAKELKTIKGLNAPELKVEYEKIVAEAKASEGTDAE